MIVEMKGRIGGFDSAIPRFESWRLTTVFTVVGKQVLHVRADYRDRVDTQDGHCRVRSSGIIRRLKRV